MPLLILTTMEIYVKEPFKYAKNGHNVIHVDEGLQDMDDKGAEIALRNDWGEKQAEMPENKAVQPPENKEYPIEKGAGWYLLSNGEKVRGKKNAKEAQKELDK